MLTPELLARFERNYALIQSNQGDFVHNFAQAKIAISQTVHDTHVQYGEDSPQYAFALAQMGLWHNDNSDYSAAEPLLKQAVQTLNRHQNEAQVIPLLAEAKLFLGWHCFIKGQLAQAHDMLENALALLPEQAQTGLLATRIEWTKIKISNHNHLFELQLKTEQIIHRLQTLLGENHRYTAYVYIHLAQQYRLSDHLEQAQAIIKHVMPVIGTGHPFAIPLYIEYALQHYQQHKYRQAHVLWQTTLNIAQRIYRPQHAKHGILLLQESIYEFSQNHYARAFELASIARQNLNQNFEEDHPLIIMINEHLQAILLKTDYIQRIH